MQDTPKNTTASDPKVEAVDSSKRKSLRNILAAGSVAGAATAASTEWSKPVVQSVILPSHGTMTGQVVVPASAGAAAAAAVTQNASESKSIIAKISDRMFEKVVPSANAIIKFNYEGFLCVTPVDDAGTIANVLVTVTQSFNIPAGKEEGDEEEGSGEENLLIPCVTTFEYAANNVPVGGGNVPLNFNSSGCDGVANFDLETLMEKTGIVPPAHAIGSGNLRVDVLSNDVGSQGSFDVPLIDGAAFTFDIPPGGCSPVVPQCCTHSPL